MSNTRFTRIRQHLEAFQPQSGLGHAVFEFMLFGFKQAWACLFGGLLLFLLLLTHYFYPADWPLARYDFLFLAALAIQALMLWARLETWEEARVILAFHLVGTIMELFKTSVGSWAYPEENLLRIMGVPLFSGFMYAAVGSYIARVWRIFDFHFSAYPPPWQTGVLAVAIYVNFFSHHSLPDFRYLLFAITALLYGRTRIYFKPHRKSRWMPMLLGFLLVAMFIWGAENIATLANAWIYPHQYNGWRLVPLSKLGSWYLLMIISFVLVAFVHKPREFISPVIMQAEQA